MPTLPEEMKPPPAVVEKAPLPSPEVVTDVVDDVLGCTKEITLASQPVDRSIASATRAMGTRSYRIMFDLVSRLVAIFQFPVERPPSTLDVQP